MPIAAPKTVRRRSLLKVGALLAGAGALPLLAACSNQTPASPTNAPSAAPTAAPVQTVATAPGLTSAAATPSSTAVAAITPSTIAVVAATPTTAAAAATAPAVGKLTAKITGSLQIIQQRGFNPLQTQYIHNLLIKVAAQNNWPMDKSYEDGFTGGGNFFEKMAAAVHSGDSPDLFFGSEDAFQLSNQGSIQPLDDVVAWATQQFGNPAPIQKLSNQIDGTWYGVPFFCATSGYWVRKSWFDSINFDISKQYSLQEWLEASVKVSDAGKKRWGWGNTVNRSNDGERNVSSALYQAGSRSSTEDNKVAFNSPDTIAAYDWLKDMYTNDKYKVALPPGVNAWTDPSNNEAYLAGTIGFTSNSGTMFATAMIQKPDIAADTWLAQHPSGPVGQKQSLIVAAPSVFEFFVFNGAKNVDAAKQLIQLLLSKENQKAVWDNSPGHSLPAYTWGWDEPELKKVPNNVIKVSQDILGSNKAFLNFLPQPAPKLWINAVDAQVVKTDVMADVLKGTPTKDAVANGAATIQKIYDKFQGK